MLATAANDFVLAVSVNLCPILLDFWDTVDLSSSASMTFWPLPLATRP